MHPRSEASLLGCQVELRLVRRTKAMIIAHVCVDWKHTHKDDFVWFAVHSHGNRKMSPKRMVRTRCAKMLVACGHTSARQR